MRFIYTFGIYCYALGVRIAALFNSKARLMVKGWKHTFGRLAMAPVGQEHTAWFHASSLGEYEQARPVLNAFRQQHPEYKVCVTFFSPSGYEVRKNTPEADFVCYLPMDTFANASRFVNLLRPTVAFFVKYDYWFNYLEQLRLRDIPTYIFSAIYRPKQYFFRWYGSWYLKHLKVCFRHIFVQNETSLQLLKSHGIDHCSIAGDTRFDRVADVREAAREFPLIETFAKDAKFTLVMGSSWPADEEIVIPYFNAHRDMKLIIAPHEFDRHRLHVLMSKLSRPARFYSEATQRNLRGIDCLIIDSFGLLSSLYRYGQAAYIGGGFGAGIHNINEAAVYGIPVIFGPKHHKFQEASDLIALDGAMSIHDADSFSAAMDPLLENEPLRLQCGKTAGEYIQSHLGGTQLIYDYIFNPQPASQSET